jgi:hypothetical protein
MLRQSAAMLATEGSAALDTALFLHPDIEPLHHLRDILTEITERGLDTVLTELRTSQQQADLINGWLNTPTWTASRDYLREHPTLATDPGTAAFLQELPDDPVIDQHLAILHLAQAMPLDDVYDAVTDPTMGIDAAMAAVETGDAPRIIGLLHAVPSLTTTPFVTPYLAAVLTVLTDTSGNDTPHPADLISEAATQGTDTQRQAGAARLRRLARRHPDSTAALEELATRLLTTAAQAGRAPEPAGDPG